MSQSFVLFGNESILAQCGARILSAGHKISAIVTRTQALQDWAKSHDIPSFAPDDSLGERLANFEFDWILSLAYLSLIPDDILAMARKGAVNFHDGLLPAYAGLNTPVWARINQEAKHGITWHFIGSGVDTGDILSQHRFSIDPGDTAFSLNAKCFETAIESFDGVLEKLVSGAAVGTPQNFENRKVYSRLDRPNAFGLIDFSSPTDRIIAFVQALDHGGYWNPLTTPKIVHDNQAYRVSKAKKVGEQGTPGLVLDSSATEICVATADGAIQLGGITNTDGSPLVAPASQVFPVGSVLQHPDLASLQTASKACAKTETFWRTALAAMPGARHGLCTASPVSGEIHTIPMQKLDSAAVFAWACTQQEQKAATLALGHEIAMLPEISGLVSHWVPVSVNANDLSVQDFSTAVKSALQTARDTPPFACDLLDRAPELEGLRCPDIGISFDGKFVTGCALTVFVDRQELAYDPNRIDETAATLLAKRLNHVAMAFAASTPTDRLDALSVLPEDERDLILRLWNQTEKDYDASRLMHHDFEDAAAKHPDAIALVFEDQTLTYAALDAGANALAKRLTDVGVGAGDVVGLFIQRSPDMVMAALGILKSGAAYLALDPAYPADRTAYCLSDSRAKAVLTHSAVASALPKTDSKVLLVDAPEQDPRGSFGDVHAASPDDLAYMIYTSGSTGNPKGVMVEHRNVANFFAGMDDRIPHESAGTWLAVTSLSFDISVLEIFWTLGRGFKVVLTGDEGRTALSNGPLPSQVEGMDFSLFYWGNDDGAGRDKYKSLLDGAKFADTHGFAAIWTPERHFHAFGGPYPNPSVTGAAVAAITENLSVRAGSCVAPLHHPARIAEEWSVIDNLTNGRAGLAIASGWQPDDFVLRPENTPPRNRDAMFESIDILRDLWSGKPVAFPKADGSMHDVVTQPRPVSSQLPIWVTTAGNPETWRQAGEIGANVLTHLLGQSIPEVGEKIKIYHQALRDNGYDPADFNVTLMLHTYLADDREAARETARGPMKDYLRSAAGLIKQFAWAFPAFKRPKGVETPFDLDLGILDEDELDAILEFAFTRYFEDSGLFGTVADAMKRVEDVKRIGVTEVACLIDYGIPAETVLQGLRPLATVVKRCNQDARLDANDFSVAAQMTRHKVTHLQCTPSMAQMFMANDETREAMRGLQHLLLGGEALPGALVKDIQSISKASITNMYGPTETTIWSTSATATPSLGTVPIGTPIANTKVYVLDDHRQVVPIGTPGELWIGGHGVTRGYWNRPDLTAERFVKDPFDRDPGARMYRTGDLVAWRADGHLDYIGRTDFQVKVRGYRIELGEIEAAIDSYPGVHQSAVIVHQESAGDQRIHAYYTGAKSVSDARLKSFLSERLPAHMVPSGVFHLDSMPLTPNKKIDRQVLQALGGKLPRARRETPTSIEAPRPPDRSTETRIAEIWRGILGDVEITASDNFFDLGGHSLLAVQSHRAIRDRLEASKLSITDIFRFPVLKDLARRVDELTGAAPSPSIAKSIAEQPIEAKAELRASAIERRRALRAKRKP